jgi:hypothetical protein
MNERGMTHVTLPRQWPYTAEQFMERTHCAPHYLAEVLAGLVLAGWIEVWGMTSEHEMLYGPSEWVQKATATQKEES